MIRPIERLSRHSGAVRPANIPAPNQDIPVPKDRQTLLIAAGGSGREIGYRYVTLCCLSGTLPHAVAIDTDQAELAPLMVRVGDHWFEMPKPPRFLLGNADWQEAIAQDAILRARYTPGQGLLRGIQAWDMRFQALRGAFGHPPLAQMRIDIEVREVADFLRRALVEAFVAPPQVAPPGASDWEKLVAARRALQRNQEEARIHRIVMLFSGAGSTGHAAGQTLPYLLWQIIRDLNIAPVEMIGVLFGPHAYEGLTQYTWANDAALRRALAHRMRHGLGKRTFREDFEVDLGTQVPFDHILLIDGPGAQSGHKVSDVELRTFYDQAALALRAALQREIWDAAIGQINNDNLGAHYVHIVRSAEAFADGDALRATLARRLEMRVYEALSQNDA